MARVLVEAGTVADGRVTALKVQLAGLPSRELSREQVISWMRDGHSFLPIISGVAQRALVLVEVGEDEPAWFVRDDTQTEAEDLLPRGLPRLG